MKKLLFLATSLFLIFSACRKDEESIFENSTTTSISPITEWIPEEVSINTNLTGFVIDENKNPVADAIVRLGNFETRTDNFGHFFYTQTDMNQKGQLVQIEKDGYFKGSRRFFPLPNTSNRVEIQLIPKKFKYNFESSTGGSIFMSSGASIDFSANSIVDKDGNLYSGKVMVAAEWLDPTNPGTLDRMPGNLQGLDQNLIEVALKTYGMIAVELEGENKQSLNIADGTTANIHMPIPLNLQDSAPDEIPLWSYNEKYGMWMEESSATLTNGFYIGTVSHFSFWNCDESFPLVEFDLRLIDTDGIPINYYKVFISRQSGISGFGYTNAAGNLSGKIPANVPLVLKIINKCNEEAYTSTIGPFADDVSLGDITIALPTLFVSGNLLDCNNNPVENAAVVISYRQVNTYYYLDNSSFNISIHPCLTTDEIEVRAINLDDLEESITISSPTNNQHELGDISICGGALSEYMKIIVDGEFHTYTDIDIYLLQNNAGVISDIDIWVKENPNEIDGMQAYLNIDNNGSSVGLGNFDGDKNSIFRFENNYENWELYPTNPSTESGFEKFSITEYNTASRSFIAGEFSGYLTNYAQNNEKVYVEGSFRVRR